MFFYDLRLENMFRLELIC